MSDKFEQTIRHVAEGMILAELVVIVLAGFCLLTGVK